MVGFRVWRRTLVNWEAIMSMRSPTGRPRMCKHPHFHILISNLRNKTKAIYNRVTVCLFSFFEWMRASVRMNVCVRAYVRKRV